MSCNKRLNERLGVIAYLTQKKDYLGKTAMMKTFFFLQDCFSINLDYDFHIYTYGPYSQEVMNDIDLAHELDIIVKERKEFSNGHTGYLLKPGPKNNEFSAVIDDETRQAIDDILDKIGDKNSKDMELLATIAFIYNALGDEGDQEEIKITVKKIKPHFALEEIQVGYDLLEEKGIIH